MSTPETEKKPEDAIEELSESELDSVAGGTSKGTKTKPLEYIKIELHDVLIS